MGFEVVEGGVRLRPWTALDTEALSSIFDDEAVYRFTPIDAPFTPASAAERIALLTAGEKRRTSYSRAVVVDDELVGDLAAYARRPGTGRRTMGISWVIGARFRGRGIAKAALRPFLADLQSSWCIEEFVADIAHENVASQHVAAACGFVPDATQAVQDGEGPYSIVPWRLRFPGSLDAQSRS